MNWKEACENTSLKDLPFKIELDESGKIMMSPVKVRHSAFQGEIEYLLRNSLKDGKSFPECAISTRKGTKVADVVWSSPERFEQIKNEIECPVAPEICIEVLSSTNTEAEMIEKRELYFENGAIEVWICNKSGEMSFHSPEKEMERSMLAPGFPEKIII